MRGQEVKLVKDIRTVSKPVNVITRQPFFRKPQGKRSIQIHRHTWRRNVQTEMINCRKTQNCNTGKSQKGKE